MSLRVILFAFLAATTVSVPCAAGPLLLHDGRTHALLQWPWDQPPAEFKEMERQGFHAGVQAAIKDYDHHRSPEPERRSEYRHPHVERGFQDDYRRGFVRGYNDAYKHLMNSQGQHR